MVAIKAKFDGRQIILPEDVRGLLPGEVILIFEDAERGEEATEWRRAQEATLAKAWDNDDDAIYDAV